MSKVEIGKHCSLTVLPEIPCVEIQWMGMPSSEEFRKGCDTAIELMQKNGISKVLTDNSQAQLFKVDDQKWLNDNWLPRAELAGYKVSATILGDSDAFVKFAAQSIASKRDHSKFLNKFFKTRDEALEWLKSL